MKKIILAFFFITSVLSSQNIDFNNIKIDDVKNIINNVLNKNKPEKNQIWSGVPGDLNFNIKEALNICQYSSHVFYISPLVSPQQ